MKSDTRKEYNWRRLIPGLIVSAVCLAIVFWISKPKELLQALKLADLWLIGIGVLITVTWLVVRAQVWRELLQGKPSFEQAFFTVSEGYLLNNLLPFRLGEIARSLLMSQKIRTPFWEVFSTVVIERLLDLIMASSLLFMSLFFVVGAEWAWKATIGMGIVVLISLCLLYIAAIRRNALTGRVQSITLRWPKASRMIGDQLMAFLTGLAVITQPWRFFRIVLWMILNWSLALSQYFVYLKAFQPAASLLQTSFTLGVASLGIAAPSSPGSIGVYELAVVTGLAVFGLAPAVSLAYALTMHFLGILITGILGAVGLARDGETLSSLYSQARHVNRRVEF
jgi:glycosyltransferase 2 family protein